MIKSPFLVFENFISPKQCENIVDSLDMFNQTLDKDGNPLRMFKHSDENEKFIFTRFKTLVPDIEKYYEVQYKGTEKMLFEWYSPGVKTELVCDNSQYLRKKWVRVYERDFTCKLFLSEFQDKVPFETDYEVYGGKLSFPQHGFGFNPQRGTLVIYPSGPHFINQIEPILAGDLFQVKFHVAAKLPYLYSPDKFGGTFKDWFAEQL